MEDKNTNVEGQEGLTLEQLELISKQFKLFMRAQNDANYRAFVNYATSHRASVKRNMGKRTALKQYHKPIQAENVAA